MSLCDVETDRRYGDKKTEVLAAIEERLGLTFEQFKRSAMLAQGDFAAFLHADDRNRADLLERVTGTEVYSRISRASYERTTTEKRSYEALVTQAERLGRLTPEQRSELLAKLETTKAALTTAEEAHGVSAKTVAWFDDHAVLEKRCVSAIEAVETAQRAVTNAHPRRKHLARVISMAPLRLPLSRRDDAVRHNNNSLTAEQTAVTTHRLANETLTHAKTAAEKEALRRKEVQIIHREMEPVIVKARALDARIDDAVSAESHSKRLADTALIHATTTAGQVTSLKQALTVTEERAAMGRAWNVEHPHAARLANVIEPVQRSLTTLSHSHRRLADHARRHPSLLKADLQAQETLAGAQAAALKHAEMTSQLQTSLHSARIAIAEDARPKLDARQRVLDGERERVIQLEDAYRASTIADRERVALATEQTLLDAATAADSETLAKTTPLRHDATVRLTEAEHSLDALRAALSATDLRASLEPGAPCSVCGSTEHPWATDNVVGGLHQAANERVQQLKVELAAHTETLSTVQARLTTAAETKARLTQRKTAAETELQHAQQAWSQATAQTGLPADPLQAQDTVQAERKRVAAAVETLRAESEQLNALETGLRTAQSAYDSAVSQQNIAKAALETTETDARKTAQSVSESDAEQTGAQEAATTAFDTVADALGERDGWQELAATDAAGLLIVLNAEAAAYSAHHTTLVEADARLADLRPQLAEAQATAKAAHSDHEQKDEHHGTTAKHLATLRGSRATLLSGEAVTAVVQRQKQQQTEVETAYVATEDRHQKAISAVSSAQGSLTSVTQQRQAAETAMTLAQKVLNTSLQVAHVDEQTAVSLLAHTEEWVEGETRDLAAVDRAVQTSETVLKERQTAVEAHRESAPQGTQEDARTTVTKAKLTLEVAREAHGDNTAAQRRDDDARQQGQELDDQLSAQHAVVERWAAISNVIGSADGKLFRTFAQGLTLDSLLVYANHHLSDLAPRYRLQRVPREDLALQIIDQDMGDEVRAIPSLSGGETFLTSLALALGLSSLAASETPVESLFIDEGFGTLDRDTLEIALAALDALQASGRQVGLISHVDGLSEHIGVAIHVQKLGAGKSRVVLPDSVATP
ncbi:MAG: exonuclease SbcC [Myxococcota bacterium]|jgi:exonuclease SbcC